MKNLFTIDNAAMLLIDHQQGTVQLAKNRSHEEILQNTRALARIAVETGMPLVLTTSMEDHFQGPLFEDLESIAPDAYTARIRRPGTVDCWMYEPYREAVLATGRKKLIMAGLTNDVCIVYPSISATEEGFEVQVVADAGGSPSQTADEVSLQRMAAHGVTITTTNQLLAELASSWSEGHGQTMMKVMYEEIISKLVTV